MKKVIAAVCSALLVVVMAFALTGCDVAGSAARTNKLMLIMMPLIYGVFSFFYSAAFSIYMITSTLFGLVTTVIINKAMDVSFSKKIENGTFNANGGRNNRKRLK